MTTQVEAKTNHVPGLAADACCALRKIAMPSHPKATFQAPSRRAAAAAKALPRAGPSSRRRRSTTRRPGESPAEAADSPCKWREPSQSLHRIGSIAIAFGVPKAVSFHPGKLTDCGNLQLSHVFCPVEGVFLTSPPKQNNPPPHRALRLQSGTQPTDPRPPPPPPRRRRRRGHRRGVAEAREAQPQREAEAQSAQPPHRSIARLDASPGRKKYLRGRITWKAVRGGDRQNHMVNPKWCSKTQNGGCQKSSKPKMVVVKNLVNPSS